MDFLRENKKVLFIFLGFGVLLSFLIFEINSSFKLFSESVDNDVCLGCHEDKSLTVERQGKKHSLFIDKIKLSRSVHRGVKCSQCHASVDPDNIPHSADPRKVDCSGCHKSESSQYSASLHGKAQAKGDRLAPKCQTCHGSHEILPAKDRNSPVYPVNVPRLCGGCHREGTPVQLQRNIPENHILENYTESMHGEALLRKGLTVAANCASCHTAHNVLPHTDPQSSINRKNIASTCTKCHAAIEQVHLKVIKGQLWEKEAKVLPACVDCHQPHKVRKVFYEANLADAGCRKCHDEPGLKSKDGRSMTIQHGELASSTHSKIACAQCHTDIDPAHKRPCDNIRKKVDCSSCHTAVGDDFSQSIHGKLLASGDNNAPNCTECHGTHGILKRTDSKSTIFPLNIPKICSKCHQDGKVVSRYYKGVEPNIINNYTESIHGKGLLKSGLTVTATCTDCHTAHKILPPSEQNSSVHSQNLPNTCGNCHFGIQEIFSKSVHSPFVTKTNKKLPVCNDCHTAHTISRTDVNSFRQEILSTCGKCHKKVAETYFDTYHGKVSRLGSARAAKCYDCHGSHDILPPDNPNSRLSHANIIGTCRKCHSGATRGFTKYLTHATHHDSDKYFFLFITFWGMTLLLISTFSVSFAHTLMWLPRSFQWRKQMKALHKELGVRS